MNYKKGLTLTELMVTCAILVIAFVSFLYGLIGSIKLVNLSKEMFFALNSVDAKLEQIRAHTFANTYNYYTTAPNNTFEVNGLPIGTSKGNIKIDNTNPQLLIVYISVCWRSFDGRIIGEDLDLDGNLAPAEDLNANNKIDSPVMLVSYITRR